MKTILLLITFSFLVYASEQNPPKPLVWEQILKDAQKQEQIKATPVLPELKIESISNNSIEVIGIFTINNKRIAYIKSDNKSIKASQDMIINENKIESIENDGIYIIDKRGNKFYLPLKSLFVQEKVNSNT